MQPDDRANAEQLSDRFPAEPNIPIPRHRHPQQRAERREQAAPCDQHRRANRGEPAENSGRREDDNEQMELEERADGGVDQKSGKRSSTRFGAMDEWIFGSAAFSLK